MNTYLDGVGGRKLAVANVHVDAQLGEAFGAVVVRDARPKATKALHHLNHTTL